MFFKRLRKDGEDLLLGERLTEQEVQVVHVLDGQSGKGQLEEQFPPSRSRVPISSLKITSANVVPLWFKTVTNAKGPAGKYPKVWYGRVAYCIG